MEEVKTPSLKRVLSETNKTAKAKVIGTVPDMVNLELERLKTGVSQLDDILGGGFVRGRIVELYGLPSSGKSLIALLTIKEAQRLGLDCIYIDTENTFDVNWAKLLGIDIDKLILCQLSIAEDVLELVVKLLEANPAIIVLDSIAATVTRSELEEGIDKPFMAPRARLLSKALTIINEKKKDTTIIFINQLRANMTLYGPHFYTTSGNALPFYCSTRIEVKKLEFIYEDNKKTKPIIGQIVACKTTKNKTYIPQKTSSFKFYYEDGKII